MRRSSPSPSEVVALGLPLTLNAVIHRGNIDEVEAVIDLAVELGAKRLEIAHTQYYGWAYVNRAALMPARADVDRSIRDRRGGARAPGRPARHRPRGARTTTRPTRRPAPAAGGGELMNVTPAGKVLPCHAAETIPGLEFWHVTEHSLADIWDLLAGLQGLSRHGLDAGALPELRPQGARLGRLPLPGAGAHRRRRRDRSGLLAVAASTPASGASPTAEVGRGDAAGLSSTARIGGAGPRAARRRTTA